MISFKANYINSASINRISTNTPVKASIVELNPRCAGDVSCIQDVATDWDNGMTFANNIKNHFLECNWLRFNNGKRFFALTMQRNNFENLKPYNVLGIVQITEGTSDQIKINYLQVDPSNNYFAPNRTFSKIGKVMLDSVVGLFNKNVVLNSVASAKKFYKKYGFEQVKRSSEFILRSKS